MLRLSDLLDLPRPGDGWPDRSAFDLEIERRGIHWPEAVVRQWLWEHGKHEDFLAQYDHLDLLALKWELRQVAAADLCDATFYEEFADYVAGVERAPYWKVDQYRKGFGEDVWTTTWRLPPILVSGELRAVPQLSMHLVEGHTRLGILRGLVRLGEASPSAHHAIYLAIPE